MYNVTEGIYMQLTGLLCHLWVPCISRPSIPEARTLVFLDMHHAVVHPLLKASVETRHGSKPRTSFWMGLGGVMKFRWTVPGNRKRTWLICRCHPSVTRCLVIVCGLLSIRSSHLQSDNRKKKRNFKQAINPNHTPQRQYRRGLHPGKGSMSKNTKQTHFFN